MLESPSLSDDDLLRLISKGQENAFVEFYRKYQSGVYRFSLQMSGKPEIAQEIVQEVFLTVMSAAKKYDSRRGSAAAFLHGIARNLLLRYLERERPYAGAWEDVEEELDALAAQHDVAGELARNERVAMLHKAVLALPPAYREVVVLCDLNEVDYAEAAGLLGCAIGTIRSRLHRARALLLEKMRAAERCAV